VVQQSKQPSVNGSARGSRHEGNSTPRSSHNHLSEEMNDEEQELVRNVLRGRGPPTARTSYAATSVLDPGAVSHFHDMDLCILLHQLDDPMQHDVVKRAVRKAVKARVKQLGMSYDNEVCVQIRLVFIISPYIFRRLNNTENRSIIMTHPFICNRTFSLRVYLRYAVGYVFSDYR
jgi:hypothetical protein